MTAAPCAEALRSTVYLPEALAKALAEALAEAPAASAGSRQLYGDA
jgi:hypothetical protein